MGQYLSAPVTEKESAEDYDEHLAYGLAAMQGWRVSMEDAHITKLHLDRSTDTSFFSVFDGHGGKAVAKFCANHLAEEFLRTEEYRRGDLAGAITAAYHRLDVLLDSDAGKAELKQIVGATSLKKPMAGLFTEIQSQIRSDEDEVAAPAPAQPAGDSEAAGVEGEQQEQADRSGSGKDRLKKVDSSKDFLQSHLMRASVITPLPDGVNPEDVDPDAARAAVGSSNGAAGGEPTSSSSEGDDDERREEHHAGGVGCTALTMVVRGLNVLVANTGDSRCVLSRRGQAIALTLDHKPILFEEARRIIKAGGFVRDNRINGALNVSRTIGDLDFKRNEQLEPHEQMVIATPDIEELSLQEGDEFAILACDGIWDVLSNQEAVDFVRKRLKANYSLKRICEDMCDACLAPDLKGLCRGADNMSVIVVLFRKTARLHGVLGKLWHAVRCSVGGSSSLSAASRRATGH